MLTARGESIWPELETCADRVRERALAELDDKQRKKLEWIIKAEAGTEVGS